MRRYFNKLRTNKTWAVLGFALVIGVLAALAARNYLSNQMEAIEAKDRGGKVNLVVAKRELRRGEKLSSDNVAVRPVPVDFAHSSAVRPGDFERIEGQTLAFSVKAGEMILWSLVEGRRAPTFSARIESGLRAVTLPVDEINSISGMLEPGDTIDLIATIDRKGVKATFPMLQSVQVMAVGQRSVDDPKSGERRQYSTVTLETTTEQAQNVIAAREAGRITALLRNPQDKARLQTVDLMAMLGSPSSKAFDKSQSTEVPVLYGGIGAKLPPEGLTLGARLRASAAAASEATALITRPSPLSASGSNPPGGAPDLPAPHLP